MTVTSKRKAWQAADALMPTDYEKDEARTVKAWTRLEVINKLLKKAEAAR